MTRNKKNKRPQSKPISGAKIPLAKVVSFPPAAAEKVPALPSLLLTVKELCELLGVSRSKVVRMEKSGFLPGRVDLAGSVRYDRGIIEKWIQKLSASAELS